MGRVLSDKLLQQLIQTAAKVERHYKSVPQDIEWAATDGQVYIVQSRPITTLQEKVDVAIC